MNDSVPTIPTYPKAEPRPLVPVPAGIPVLQDHRAGKPLGKMVANMFKLRTARKGPKGRAGKSRSKNKKMVHFH